MFLVPFKAIRLQTQKMKSWVKRQIGESFDENYYTIDFLSLIQPNSNKTFQIRKRLHTLISLGSWFCLTSNRNDAVTPTLNRIPTNVIYEDIAKPLLCIQNLLKDKRISYHHYENPTHKIKEDVDKGKYVLGIQHYPIPFRDIVPIVENFDLLPQRERTSNPNLYLGCLSLTFYHND